MKLPLLFCILSPAASAQVWTAGDHIQPPRISMATVTLGESAFFGGGSSDSGSWPPNLHDEINVYDSASGSWTLERLSEARHSLAATSVGDVILFAGGATGPQGTPSVFSSATVDIYDPATGLWTMDNLSEGRVDLAATSVGGYALFAGGRADQPGGGHANTATVDAYHAATGTWSQATLSAPRRYPVAVTVGPYAFFSGGIDGAPTAVIDVYDSTVGPPSNPAAWSVAMMSEPRLGHAATAAGDLALLGGGNITGSDSVDVYDASVGPPSDPSAWSIEYLSVGRWNLSATTVGPYAMFAGGRQHVAFTNYDLVDVYDTTTGTWSTSSLSRPRVGLVATTVGGQALFAGGGDSVIEPVVDTFTPFLPVNYCGPAIANSTGQPAVMGATGHVAVMQNDLTLGCSDMPPNSFGFFLASPEQGFAPAPGGSQGNLCLGGSIGRFVGPGQIQNAGAAGAISLVIDLTQMPSPTGFVQVAPGDTWNFQCWYRDMSMTGQAVSNFSGGLEIRLR